MFNDRQGSSKQIANMRALESGEPCLAILQQIAAVRGASNGLMSEMVEIHLKDELVSG
ncbi:metal-sensing transcriptional repressor, partial [Salmonella enterica subsp. enterica serovar Kentucky]|nr:metal-sensing transcriptional repressor [Salmonella enterica subsp. enterica serovar Kentucky]